MSTTNLSPYSSDSSRNSPYYPYPNSSQSYSMYQPTTPELTPSPSSNYEVPSPIMGNNHGPYLKIIAQPQPKFRFRYQSEMIGTHGCLMAETNGRSPNQKSYVQVELQGFQGREAIIRCSLVTNETVPKPHVHRLAGENNASSSDNSNSDYYDVVLPGNRDSWIATFTGLTIIHTGKKQVREVLEKRLLREAGYRGPPDGRNLSATEERKVKDQADQLANNMDLHSVRLRFEAFSNEGGHLRPLCEPVYSKAVHNLKSTSAADLRIVRVDKVVSSCAGHEEVFIFVEKVNKKDIKIRFFELDDAEREIWTADAEFSELDVHHQYAIAFKTPPYRDQNIKEDVSVFFQLYRPSNKSFSEPRLFTYKPREDLNLARKRRGEFITDRSENSTRNKRFGLFDAPSPECGNGSNSPSNSSSVPGNGFSPSGGENSRSPGGGSVTSGQQQASFQHHQQQLNFSQQPVRNFPVQNISPLPAEPKKEPQQGTFYPIYYVSSPEVVARGISPREAHQAANVSSVQQQQQLPQLSDLWLNEDFSTLFQPPMQQQQYSQQPLQLTAEPIDIQDSDILKLLDGPYFSQNLISSGQDFVYTDAAPVRVPSETETVTSALKNMSIEAEEKNPTDKLQSSSVHENPLEQLSGLDVVRQLFLNVASDLHSYAATGTISNLLKRTVYLLAIQSEDGDNALHCALWNNQLDVFYSMLNAAKSHKATLDLVNSQNDLNLTPLHMAVMMNNPKAVAALLEAGADPLIVDKEGNTPIHIAAKDRELTPCLEHILQNYTQKATKNTFKVDMLNYEGMAPLHLAVSAASLEAVKILIQAGANVNVVDAKMGRTPLHMAIEKKQKEIAYVFLFSPKVNVNQQSYDGSTPLHVAVAEQLEDICQLLCVKGADPSTKSFVNIFAGGFDEVIEEETDSEDSEEQDDIDGEKYETEKTSGVSPLELAAGRPTILNILKQNKPLAKVSVDVVETDCGQVSSVSETSSRALDSGIDIMASRELSAELDDSVIDMLNEALESSAPDCWKILAKSLSIPAALMGTVNNHKSPVTYILQNLEVLEATPQTVLNTFAEMKLTQAFKILDDYLNH